MSQLTFPITTDGLSVDVRVNLDATTLQSLRASGQPIPASAHAKGLIDTGSDISAVASSILQQLAIPVYAHRWTRGVGGLVPVRLFKVTLFVLNASHPQLPWHAQADLLVMELPPVMPVDVLIGMDVLLTCKMLLDGPAKEFTLEF